MCCVEMKAHSWYYGRITRAGAEKLLMNKHEGAFVVRVSESSPGDFSLRYTRWIHHLTIGWHLPT